MTESNSNIIKRPRGEWKTICFDAEYTGFAHENQQPYSLADTIVLVSIEGHVEMYLLEPGNEKHGARELNTFISDTGDEEARFVGIYKRIRPQDLR